ncbi:MAG: hypothetical protein O3A00_15780, partial [Planctomycetota bacterium]|nr:hypothetical protein [Planctomycetota bacterium]
QTLLLRMAIDSEPAIAASALERLLEIDTKLVLPLAADSIQNRDAKVRLAGIQALIDNPTVERVAILAPLLADKHPRNRRLVRVKLVQQAADETFRVAVILQAKHVLASNRWRGLEQAMLLLAALDEKSVSQRVVELLESDRPEIFITAAWTLRRLAVPATYPAMFAKAKRLTAKFRAMEISDDLDHQLGQLFQAFGEAKYAPAVSHLREFVPKNLELGEQSRGSAVWALGRFHVGVPEPTLARQLEGRLGDLMGIPAEAELVRAMSAITLGRMQSRESLDTFRKVVGFEGVNSGPGYFSAWAIHEITGEPIPKLSPIPPVRGNWFLQPVTNSAKE